MELQDIRNLLDLERYDQVISLIEADGALKKTNDVIEILIKSYNEYSIQLLNLNNPFLALEYLRTAESYSFINGSLRARTFNNIACCYNRLGKYSLALNYLEKALILNPEADIYLNMCVVLSAEGKHSKALEQAMYAIIYLQSDIIDVFFNGKISYHPKFETLAIAYHNIAVELEFLKKIPESMSFYRKSVEITERNQALNPSLKNKLKENFDKALKSSVISKNQDLNLNSSRKRLVYKNIPSKSPIRTRTSPILSQKYTPARPKTRKLVTAGVSKTKYLKFINTMQQIRNNEDNSAVGLGGSNTERIGIDHNPEVIKTDQIHNNPEVVKTHQKVLQEIRGSPQNTNKSSYPGVQQPQNFYLDENSDLKKSFTQKSDHKQLYMDLQNQNRTIKRTSSGKDFNQKTIIFDPDVIKIKKNSSEKIIASINFKPKIEKILKTDPNPVNNVKKEKDAIIEYNIQNKHICEPQSLIQNIEKLDSSLNLYRDNKEINSIGLNIDDIIEPDLDQSESKTSHKKKQSKKTLSSSSPAFPSTLKPTKIEFGVFIKPAENILTINVPVLPNSSPSDSIYKDLDLLFRTESESMPGENTNEP